MAVQVKIAGVKKQNLGEMLVAANLIDEVQMQIALAEQKETGKKFGSTLVDLKFIDENVLAAFLSKQIDVPCISLLHLDIPRKVLRRIPPRVARECNSIPIRIDESRLEVAMVDPTDANLLQLIEAASGLHVAPLVAPQSSILKMIDRYYPLDEDDTLATKSNPSSAPVDPIFSDLIDEIENADFEGRLERIEASLQQVWTLLERMLRILEEREPAGRERLHSEP